MKATHTLVPVALGLAATCCLSCGVQQPVKEDLSTQLTPQSVHFKTATVTISSPGPLSPFPYTMSMEERSFLRNSETHIYSQLPDIEVVVGWTRNRDGYNADPLGGIEGIMAGDQQGQGVTEFEYQTQKTTVSGLSGVRASATYNQFGPRATESVVVSKNTQTWLVHVYVPLEAKDVARSIVESMHIRGPATERPDIPSDELEFLKIKVTLDGAIYLNAQEASLEEVSRELLRLREAKGVVLYYREGGESPPPEAERVSGAILFEIGRLDVPFLWSEQADK